MDPITLASLSDFPRQLEAYYAQVPAGFKNWRPSSWEGIPSEPFTPIEQVCHVRDIEVDGYHARFRRTLQEPNPKLMTLDGESLARERRYAAANAAEVFTAFRLARARTIERALRSSRAALLLFAAWCTICVATTISTWLDCNGYWEM
jgi:hypothetical protein